jgi:hypothetical protein
VYIPIASRGCSATDAPVNLRECKKFSTDWGSKKQFGFGEGSGHSLKSPE